MKIGNKVVFNLNKINGMDFFSECKNAIFTVIDKSNETDNRQEIVELDRYFSKSSMMLNNKNISIWYLSLLTDIRKEKLQKIANK